jgi:hypothetical protein
MKLSTKVLTLAATALAVTACGGGGGGGGPATPQNAAPTISPLSAVMTNQDTPTNAVSFTIADDGGVGALTVTADSQNTDIVPSSGVTLSGTGANRTITVTPIPDATGNAIITISVADAQGLTTKSSFGVNVVAVNRSVSALVSSTFALDANATPAQVNGFTFTQDADAAGSFDPLLQ